MKLLHTSDWHLGQNFMGKSREEEHQAFLDWLLKTIENNAVEVLLVSGDIFDTGTPPNYALELYYNFLKQLSTIPTLITTIITAGNHDSIATLKAPKQLLEVLNVHVITSGDEEERVIIPIQKGENIEAIVCAVPFLRDSVIRESLSGETVSDKERLVNAGIKSYYEKSHNQAVELRGDKNIPIIAMGHLTTVGARSSSSERDIYIGGTLDIGGDYLGKMFDYVALGHLHINQTVGANHVRYSGSPIPLSFSESTQRKKVNIVTLSPDSVTVEELEVPLTRELIVLQGNSETVQKSLQTITDKRSWIAVLLNDDNAMYANQEIRKVAQELGLTLLAVKIKKSQKELEAKAMKAISLDELSVEQVFERRLADEKLEDKALEAELMKSFREVYEKVQYDVKS